MELNDLKNMMDESASDYKLINNEVMEWIHHQSQNPLAGLAQKMKIGLMLFPITSLLFAADFGVHPEARQNLLKWMLLVILSIEFLNLLFNYGLVKQLQNPRGNTQANFISKLKSLKTSFTRQFFITAVLYALLAIALEITMYYHSDTNFKGWYHTPMPLRILCYTGFLMIQFALKKYAHKRQFGTYIVELENLMEHFK